MDATSLATFNGHDPNGTWSLFVVDDEDDYMGSIDGGWCLDITSVDNAIPVARPSVPPEPNAAGWYRSPVTVTWNWTDAGTGIDLANCADRTSSVGEGRLTLTGTCRDVAGNGATATRDVRVDRSAPTVRLTAPNATRYWQGALVRANYACADQLSGIACCRGSVADGARVDTSTRGRHRFTVTAVDRAGNEHTAAVTYSVIAAPTCQSRRASIVGTTAADVIAGTRGADVILSGGGDDTIRGLGGRDTICAGAGNDTLFGGGRADLLAGDGGTDTCNGGLGTDHAIACETTVRVP